MCVHFLTYPIHPKSDRSVCLNNINNLLEPRIGILHYHYWPIMIIGVTCRCHRCCVRRTAARARARRVKRAPPPCTHPSTVTRRKPGLTRGMRWVLVPPLCKGLFMEVPCMKVPYFVKIMYQVSVRVISL